MHRCNFEHFGASSSPELFPTALDSSKFFRCDGGMKRTQDERRELGRELVALRRQAGFRNITDLAATDIGISSKTIGKAERGDVVSEGTVADLRAYLVKTLRSNRAFDAIGSDLEAIQAWAADPINSTVPPVVLDYIPDEDLAEEVTARLLRGKTRSEQQTPPAILPGRNEEEQDDEAQAPPMKAVARVTPERERARQEQDERDQAAGEGNQDIDPS